MSEKYVPQVGDLIEDIGWWNRPMLVIEVNPRNVVIQDTLSLEFVDCVNPRDPQWAATTLLSRAAGDAQ